jgi:hypothetical protein
MTESEEFQTTFDESLPYRISSRFEELFMGCFEKSIYGSMEITLYCRPVKFKIGIVLTLLM